MPSAFATTATFNVQHKEQSMDYPAVNFLTTPLAQDAPRNIIVHSKEGVDIEQSLRNVSTIAVTWYKSSTRELYAVLGQCYELYYLIESADSSKRDKYRDEVKAAYTSLGGSQGANTMLGRIVSVVFNLADLDRRQRSRYVSVIKAGYAQEPKLKDAVGYVSWLERTGGIVAALEQRSGKSISKPEQSEINDTVRAMPATATLNIPNGGNKFVVLLAKPVDANTVEVLYQFEEDTIGDSLATRAYKAQQKVAQESKQRATAANAADELAKQQAAKEEV